MRMALVTTNEMLIKARNGHYAVGAFNVENMEMAMSVVAAAEELQAPVIIQTTPSTVKYAGFSLYYSMVKALAEQVEVPVAIHLDHGNSFSLAMQALRLGYTSIMIDGSQYLLEDNIALTKRVVEACQPSDIPVEAELGKVGGKEDDIDGGSGGFTDPEEAIFFVKETGISSLAVAIGTAHGVYNGEPRLDLERLSQIQQKVDIPLVLHGASGLSDEVLTESIRRGISKINFATQLRIAYTKGVNKQLKEQPGTIDPKKYGNVAMDCVKQFVMQCMHVCGCVGKAKL